MNLHPSRHVSEYERFLPDISLVALGLLDDVDEVDDVLEEEVVVENKPILGIVHISSKEYVWYSNESDEDNNILLSSDISFQHNSKSWSKTWHA